MEQAPWQKSSKEQKRSSQAKQPKMKEVELPNGDIELVEDTE